MQVNVSTFLKKLKPMDRRAGGLMWLGVADQEFDEKRRAGTSIGEAPGCEDFHTARKRACRPSKGNEKRREEDKIGEEKRRKVKERRTKS
jgi:hypothetical protein